MKTNPPTWGVAFAACLPLLAIAQTAKTASLMAAPPLTYQSAFADYKTYKDAALADWREVNATVAGAPGGHVGHNMGGMKGMEMPATPAASAGAPMPMKPMTAPMTEPMKAMPMKPMPMHDGDHKMGAKP